MKHPRNDSVRGPILIHYFGLLILKTILSAHQTANDKKCQLVFEFGDKDDAIMVGVPQYPSRQHCAVKVTIFLKNQV